MKMALTVASLACALMLMLCIIFPPYTESLYRNGSLVSQKRLGYGLIIAPPDPKHFGDYGIIKIYLDQYIPSVLVALMLTAGSGFGLLILHKKTPQKLDSSNAKDSTLYLFDGENVSGPYERQAAQQFLCEQPADKPIHFWNESKQEWTLLDQGQKDFELPFKGSERKDKGDLAQKRDKIIAGQEPSVSMRRLAYVVDVLTAFLIGLGVNMLIIQADMSDLEWLTFVAAIFYLIIRDNIFVNRSLGKLLFGIKIAKRESRTKASGGSLILRNLVLVALLHGLPIILGGLSWMIGGPSVSAKVFLSTLVACYAVMSQFQAKLEELPHERLTDTILLCDKNGFWSKPLKL